MWSDAATQVFFSTGVASGPIIAMSSFNPFTSNVYRDSVIVCAIDSLTSVFAGTVVFSVLGYMSHLKNVSIADVATGGTAHAHALVYNAWHLKPTMLGT